MARVLEYKILVTLFVLLNLAFLISARPLNILNTVACPDDNSNVFNHFSLGSILDAGPSPGIGHGVEDKAIVGGIKAGPSPGIGHGYALGGIKDGPSPGIGHKFVNAPTLGELKKSGPSPGAGHVTNVISLVNLRVALHAINARRLPLALLVYTLVRPPELKTRFSAPTREQVASSDCAIISLFASRKEGQSFSTSLEEELSSVLSRVTEEKEHTQSSGSRGEYMSQEFLDHLKDHGIIAHRTPLYTPQHNGVSERRNRTLLYMVRSMMSQTTIPKSFWDYALETATRILNMVPTKKVENTPYEVWHGQAPKLSYLKVWGCEALVKRDTLTKLDKLEPRSIKSTLLDPESDKWLSAMNVEMQFLKDNEVWDLVNLPPNSKTIGSKWLFKKKTDMDGAVHTYKARLMVKGYTQTQD
ncbi:retrotransposon protein, putative, ty1-copia subclass [Tanacetum coccineum]|uniref:Retrotransposon protein, putative, ty1-copia subclass n=1 Tax=Tanacetum coccineum TaxID=301880 RepID=A0ABQ5CLL4_9ASTR